MIGSGVELGVVQLRAADATPGLFNWDPILLPRTRKALANVRAGLGSAKINFIGHSALVFGAGTSGGETGGFPRVYPSVFAKALTAKDAKLPARRSSFWCNAVAGRTGDTLAGITAWDARLSGVSVNWQYLNASGGSFGPGGNYWYNSAGSGSMSFTPEETWDTALTLIPRAAVWTGSILTNIDGGTNTSTAIGGDADNHANIVTNTAGSVGTHTLNITASGNAMHFGVECYDSTKSEVRVRNWGWSGSEAGDWVTGSVSQWCPTNPAFWTLIGGDLTFINLDVNDEVANVPAAAYQANIQTLITAAKSGGSDVILVRTQRPQLSAVSLNGLDPAYLRAMRVLSLSNGAPLADFGARFDSYENASQYGWYFDTIHFNATGHAMQGSWLADLIARL